MKCNHMYGKLVFCLVSIIAVSCSNNNSEHNNEIFVDFKNDSQANSVENIFNYSNYLDSVDYVTLETSESCIVGNVMDVHFVNDRIFLSDLKNVFVFAKNGKFISKVSGFGRGHGEYSSLSFFDVNPSNDEISIYDIGNKMIHVYSIKGDFLRNVRIEGIPRDFCVLSNGNYLFYTPDVMENHYRGVWQTDPEGTFINQPVVLSGYSKKVLLTSNNLIHLSNEEVGLLGPMGFDNIYHISSDKSEIAYQITTNVTIAKSVLKDNTPGKSSEQQLYFLMNYFETKELVSFRMTDMKEKQMAVKFDKKTGKVYTEINNGQIGYRFWPGDKLPIPIGEVRSDYGVALGTIDAPNLMQFSDLQKQIAPDCTMESNPVVCLYYYKQ